MTGGAAVARSVSASLDEAAGWQTVAGGAGRFWGSQALTRPGAAVPGATGGGELEDVVDHEAALWLRPEPAEGVATVPRCGHLANTHAGQSLVDQWRLGWQERECVAPERCTRERGWWTVPMYLVDR